MEWGGLGRVRYTKFRKQNQDWRLEWIHSKGLGTKLGSGGGRDRSSDVVLHGV